MKPMQQGRITRRAKHPHAQTVWMEAVGSRCVPFTVAGTATLICCLWGELRVSLPEMGVVSLTRGEMLVWPKGEVEIASGPATLGVVAHGRGQLLSSPGSLWEGAVATDDTRVANHGTMSLSFLRAMIELVRRMRMTQGDVEPFAVPGFAEAVADYRQDLCDMLAAVPGRSLKSRQRCYERLVRTRLLVAMQPQRRWTLNEMAAAAKYSPWHFQRTFAAVFGVSPHRFVQDVRLKLGMRLLAKPHLSVTDVAAAVGYDSHSNFTRVVKERHGVTAGTLRRHAMRGRSLVADGM